MSDRPSEPEADAGSDRGRPPTGAGAAEGPTDAAVSESRSEAGDHESGTGLDTDRVARYVQWGALVALGLFALLAAVGFYTSVSRVIQVWVTAQYRPVFSAAFNLVVLLAAALGVSVLVRRLA